ncbi:MAG TPA: hypothetical protein VFF03_04275 [Rhodocyclaceae bacterium]|nr:hypothetical protein [Rhodocyclaceae bacterium]
MKTIASLATASLILTACAGIPPSETDMASVPVVRYGQQAPAGQSFILHYPAGTQLPVNTAITGTLLEKEGKADLQVSLKRDIYVYKHWASFDGKNWKAGNELVSGKIAMSLPGEADGKSPGNLSAEFNLK